MQIKLLLIGFLSRDFPQKLGFIYKSLKEHHELKTN